jgi:hypothetical protein
VAILQIKNNLSYLIDFGMKVLKNLARVLLFQFCAMIFLNATVQNVTKQRNEISTVAEFQTRDGIPNLLRKASAANGDTLRVAYLGGSITQANGWRVKSLDGLKTRFPELNWVDINAGLGGTGSNLEVFRLRKEVLDHAPDLLFV